LSKEEQQNDIKDALAFGNHKGAWQKPELLKKLIGKDLKVWLQLASTSCQRPTDPRPLHDTNEHHGTEYHQQV
jgi:hypothetical protein